MEFILSIAVGSLVSAAVYLMLSKNMLRIILGILLLGNGANLAIFLSGRIGKIQAPIITDGVMLLNQANPLPQALILTAIVISFALTVYTIILFDFTHRSIGTLNTDNMIDSEQERSS